ncbi:hypothetical protein ACGF0D_09305 [Kitasatospora sp. NPDC048298]|uniref:hypothetical protein n=1 Tax=Kitasatospora sp. NPDC048298 TaxID=3364049 RepID=UPI00371D3450
MESAAGAGRSSVTGRGVGSSVDLVHSDAVEVAHRVEVALEHGVHEIITFDELYQRACFIVEDR